MYRISLSLLLIALVATARGVAAETKSELNLWVVEASTENRETPHFDPGLDVIAAAVKGVPHNTYHKVAAGSHQLAANAPTRIPVADSHTLEAGSPKPTSDGRYRMRLRILMKTEDEPPKELEAISTELILNPEKKVLVRGLKRSGGKELLLILSLKVPKDQT